MKEEAKFYAIIAVIVVLAVVVGGFITAKFNQSGGLGGGGQTTIGPMVQVGSASNFKNLPNSLVEANSTTTQAMTGVGHEAAGEINQRYYVDGISEVNLAISAVGGTATSTIYVKPMFALDDGSNFYALNLTSTSTNQWSTSTPTGTYLAFEFDPGTASSSKLISFPIPASKQMRLEIYGDDLSTDLTDGVQAFIQVGFEQGH